VNEKSNEIIDDIETSREKLGENLNDLESRMREATNWRTYYERHPYLFIGSAVGGGLLLSGILLGNRGSIGGTVRHEGYQREKGPGGEILDQVKTALILYGAAKAKDVLGDILPAFRKYTSGTNQA
jgi:hypothetical protein